MKQSNKKDLAPIVQSTPPNDEMNDYYEAISERCGIFQVILYFFLLMFVSLSLLANTDRITYQNFYYFVKDLGAMAEQVDVLHTDSVSYPTDVSQSFSLYRKGLAVAGNNSVTLFTANGREIFSKNIRYQNPVALGSGKYLLVYELGGTQYSLYNSYTQIHTGKTENPIRGAAISPSGVYAILTQTEQHPSVVELYDSDFAILNRYTYFSYVGDMAISDRGNFLAVVLSDTDKGSFYNTLRVYEPGKTEIYSEVTFGSSLAYSLSFTDSGDLVTLCSDGVYFTGVKGKILAEHSFDGRVLQCADTGEWGCAVVLKEHRNSSENDVIVFDKKGEMRYNEAVGEAIGSVALYKNTLYLKLSDGVTRCDLTSKEIQKIACETDYRTLLALDENNVLLCSSKKAVYYRFTK